MKFFFSNENRLNSKGGFSVFARAKFAEELQVWQAEQQWSSHPFLESCFWVLQQSPFSEDEIQHCSVSAFWA